LSASAERFNFSDEILNTGFTSECGKYKKEQIDIAILEVRSSFK
jgi:hypothetical protein